MCSMCFSRFCSGILIGGGSARTNTYDPLELNLPDYKSNEYKTSVAVQKAVVDVMGMRYLLGR